MSIRNMVSLYLGIWVAGIVLLHAPPAGAQVMQCDTIDFEQFTHADGITSIDLFGGDTTISVSAFRNDPMGAVNATAYDTDYSVGEGGCGNLLNNSHQDTQIPTSTGLENPPGICADCDGVIVNVPDVDFCTAGDDTQGGVITFSGFSSDYSWNIPTYQAVDPDSPEQDILLRVGAGLTLVGSTNCDTNPACGNGEVVTVATDPHSFTETAEFTLEGSGGIDNIMICRTGAGDEGCTPGYWKNHTDSWPPTGYSPAQSVQSVFAQSSAFPSIGSASLLDALNFHGGPGALGGAKILLRAAVASLLNASNPDVEFPRSAAEIIADVDAALASGDRSTMLSLASQLDADNNLGCPLN